MADSIASIRNEFDRGGDIELSRLIEKYSSDKRSGVQALVHRSMRRQAYILSERERLEKMRVFEHQYEAQGLVCGIDEAGRGPLAGPVVAGAVILPKNCEILGLNDSKQLTEKRGKSFTTKSSIKPSRSVSGSSVRNASMRSIFCRQIMKPCAKPFVFLRKRRRYFLMTR